MPARMKCCSKASAKLKKANYNKAKKAADAKSKAPPARKTGGSAKPKKAANKKAKGCAICAKK